MAMEPKLRDEGLENMEKGIRGFDGKGQVQEQEVREVRTGNS